MEVAEVGAVLYIVAVEVKIVQHIAVVDFVEVEINIVVIAGSPVVQDNIV